MARAALAALLGGCAAAEAPAGGGGRQLPQFEFREDLARSIATLAEAAYCGPSPAMSDWSCEPCAASNISILPRTWRGIHAGKLGEANHSYVTLARLQGPEPFSDSCLLSIRGTQSDRNWLTDLEFWTATLPPGWDCPGCSVSAGLFYEWDGLEDAVVQALEEIGCGANSTRSVVATGHSMGAAVATLATYSLMTRHGMQVSMLYQFESPRVGNAAFASAFMDTVGKVAPVFRITNNRDGVPHVPPNALGYVHVDREVFYNSTGGYRVCDQTEDPECSNQFYMFDPYDHCNLPLTPSGDICECQGWVPLQVAVV